MKSHRDLPVIRVERPKPGNVKAAGSSSDVRMLDRMLAIITSASRLRARCDGLEARIKLLESEHRGGR
jgi:hypothetical protein